MGKVADILTAPEWGKKSPLEKARAQRDLFAISLEENPGVAAQFEGADDAGKQGIIDAWKTQVRAKHPEAFTTDGFAWKQDEKSKGLLYRQGVGVPIGDIETESFLDGLRSDPAALPEARAKIETLDEAEKKQMRILLASRLGDRAGHIPDELVVTGKAGPVMGALLPDGRKDPKDWRNYPVLLPAALRTGGAILGTVAGGAVGAPSGPGAVATGMAGGAAGGFVGDALAQGVEQALGTRDRYSAGEAAVNTAIAAIPAVPLGKGAGMLARAAVRGAEGAAVGAAQEAATSLVRGEGVNLPNVSTAGAAGLGLGSLIGLFEPRIAAMLAGKSRAQAVETLQAAAAKAATAEERTSLLSAQKRIEESLGIGAPQNTSAAESARALSAEHPPVVKPAREAAEVFERELPPGVTEGASVTPPPPGVAPSDSVAGRVASQSENSGALAAGSAGDQASPAKANAAVESNAELFSARQIAGQRKTIRSLEKQAEQLAGAGKTKRANAVRSRIEDEQAALANMVANKRTGPSISVGMSPDGSPDLLTDIAEHIGRIATEPPAGVARGGEFDGFAEVLSSGPARLLRGKQRGMPPDQALEIINELGPYKFGSTSELADAISKTTQQRATLAKQLGDLEYRSKFDAALFENTSRKTHLNTSDPVNVDTLNVGAEFKVRGETVKVTDVNPDTGAVTVKDGVTREIPAGTEIFPDKGEVKNPAFSAEDLEFLPPEARAIQDNAGFIAPKLAASLAGGATGFAYGAAQDPEGATEQERALNRVKKGLMMGVVGAGGVYMLGRRFTNPAPRTAAPAGSVLAEVDKHLAPVQGPSLAERAAALPNKLRGALITRFAALDKLTDDVAKANASTVSLLPELSLSRKFEQVAGASGKAAQDVRDFEDAVVRQLAPAERQDFDRMLMLKRTGQRLQWNAWLAGEQARIAAMPPAARTAEEVERLAITQDKSVAAWTLLQVDAGLAELEKKLGTPRFDQIDQLAAGEFQQQMDKGLRLQVAAGRISPESYAAIRANNDFYAPFRVLSAIEGHDGFAAGGAVDTRQQVVNAITGISDAEFKLESPTVAAAENLARGRVLAEKNLKMLELARLADADATGSLIRKLKDGQAARRGMETVNYFDQGVPMRLEVPPNVAEAIKGLNPAETGIIAGLLQRTGAVFRFGATTANAAFQARNFLAADQPRLWLVSKYGLQADPREMFQVPTDFAHALFSSILGNVAGKETALYRQFYESGAAGATFQDAIQHLGGRVGSTALTRGAAGVSGLLDDVSAITRTLEEATKLMGFKRGLRLEGIADLPPAAAARKLEEVVAEVRNFAGSPDFARHGTVAKDANMLLTFFNARIQGVTSDLSRLGGGDGAKAARDAWVRLGGTAGLTAAYFWYRNHQAENAEDFARVPEWEKQAHVMIPRYDEKGAPLYSSDEHGEKVREYWKIPKREGVKLVANLTEAALEFAQNKEPGAVAEFGVRLLEDASPINIGGKTGTERMESAIGNLNPALRLLYEVPANRDTFRHRPIVPASKQGGGDPTLQQFPGRTPELYVQAANLAPQWFADPLRSPLMLQHLTQGLTGGLVKQFTPNQSPQGERDPTAAAMATSPVGRAFVGSMQVSNDGETKLAEAALKQSRDRAIALDNEAVRELDALAKLPVAQRGQRADEIEAQRPELAKAMQDELDARAKNLTQPDRMARRMPVRDGTRARYLAERFTRLAPEKRAAFLDDQIAKGIATDGVLEQLAEILGAAGKN